MCDSIGFGVTACASCWNILILLKTTRLVDLRLKSMASVLSSRVDYIYDNTHTLILNTINIAYLNLVIFLWWSHRINIAPNHLDILILMYEIMTCITLTRSSWCARNNIIRLLTIRKEDIQENLK